MMHYRLHSVGLLAMGAQGVLEVLTRGDRRLADLPGRHLHVLLAQDAGMSCHATHAGCVLRSRIVHVPRIS
jgi:hypothetical protein